MKTTTAISLFIIFATFFIGFYFYPSMPEVMASHWNANDNADGYSTKFMGLFLLPIIMLGLFLLLRFLPLIDPFKKNYEKFRGYYDGFLLMLMIFMLYIYALTLLWNLGYRYSMTLVLLPAMGALFFFMGIVIEKLKRNWFIGIRTPWTISNDEVWDKTHDLGGKLFKAAGIVTLIGILFLDYAIFFIVVPVIAVSLFLIIYSYFSYRKITR